MLADKMAVLVLLDKITGGQIIGARSCVSSSVRTPMWARTRWLLLSFVLTG